MGIYTDSIVSGIVGLGGIVFTIKKVRGLFPSNGKPNNGNNKQELRALREVQIEQGGKIKEHEKRLDDGRTDFKEIKNDISNIKGNVQVLLDRSDRRRCDDAD